MSAVVDVLLPGLHTTVQDLGRWGHQAEGISVSGPMDPFSHRLANALVGNPRSAALLEVTLSGPALQFHDERRIAVAGASFDLSVDGHAVQASTCVTVFAGSVLRVGARRHGARAYVAVSGGFDVALLLGSRATHVGTGMGGWHGRALSRGDRLPLGMATVAPRRRIDGANALALAPVDGPRVVRVLAGPQDDRFDAAALESLVSAPYHVSVDSDRVGYRLEGARLAHRAGADIISDATPVGTLQVPLSGQPVLLMADRQTTGGYPKLATVISADIGVAGQAAPGDWLRFRMCSQIEACAALVALERRLLAVEGDAV